MLIDDSRPKLYVRDIECQNISQDNKVFFIEEGHKYYHEDDIVGNEIVPFTSSKYKFRSPTGILGEFKEHFDTVKQAKAYVKKHGLEITWKELAEEWAEKGRVASEEGTLLHGYAESLWNAWGMDKPESIKAEYVHDMFRDVSDFGVLEKTELLVYSLVLKLAGQVDLLLTNKDNSKYFLFDYKFIKKPLDKKSFYNWKTRKYKMMSGPFKKLHDSNFYHYSIQMELYRYLMGTRGKKVHGKYLLVFTPEKYEMVEGYEIKIWVSTKGTLHAKYKDFKGKIYDSSKDVSYLKKPFTLINVKK